MKKLIGKIQCKLGWHNWIPLGNVVPMSAKCNRCHKTYGNECRISKKTR